MKNNRLEFIDSTRGLMMILMALDHTRDYFINIPFKPTDEMQTNFILFFTRWLSNLCAPTFVFLVGLSMYFALKSGKKKFELSKLLAFRGIWLIIADLFIMHVAWTFTFNFSVINFGVLTVTGCGMILLSVLIYFPKKITLIFCLSVLLLHNTLDGHDIQYLGELSKLHLTTPFTINLFELHIKIQPGYVLLPWVVVPGLGFTFGYVYDMPSEARFKLLKILGTMCLLSFIIIRYTNLYGDPHIWIVHSEKIRTIYSYLNVTKYPPSLLYFLNTLSLTFFILLILENYSNFFTTILAVFGRVPFAFYLLHIFIIHSIALSVAYTHYGSMAAKHFMSNKFLEFNPNFLAPYGYNFLVVIIVWLFVIIILYPFCKWYGSFKKKHKSNYILSYL